MTDAAKPTRPRLYRVRDESVWALIRQRYLSGETQKGLAIAYDVPVCTIQKRIQREGWSKRAAIGIRPTFGGMAAPQAFELIPPSARWPEAYEAAPHSDDAHGPGERWTSLKDPPPPSMQRWPHPLPGMGPIGRPQWEPPAGHGPMPPELVPPVPTPPAPHPPEPLEDEADPPSAAEAAEQAVAAAARAVAAGRYDEAERLGRLAATLQKLAGGAGVAAAKGAAAKGKAAFRSVEDEDEDEDAEPLPFNQRPLHCTPDTCRLKAQQKEAYAAVFRIRGELLMMNDYDDILAWTDMMEGLGAPIQDEDLRRLATILKTKGPGGSHRLIDQVMERPFAPYATYNAPL